MPGYNVAAFESLTIAGTAVSLASVPSTLAKCFIGTLETAAVRVRSDGTAPTDTTGELIASGDVVVLSEHEMRATQFIRDTTTSATLQGHYYTVEADKIGFGGARG